MGTWIGFLDELKKQYFFIHLKKNTIQATAKENALSKHVFSYRLDSTDKIFH